jgi:hypothetical protein
MWFNKQAIQWPAKLIEIEHAIWNVLVQLVGNGPRVLGRCLQTNTTPGECCSWFTIVCWVCDLGQQLWEIGGSKCDHEFRKCVDSPTEKWGCVTTSSTVCTFTLNFQWWQPHSSTKATVDSNPQSMRMSLLVLLEVAEWYRAKHPQVRSQHLRSILISDTDTDTNNYLAMLPSAMVQPTMRFWD